MRNLEREIANLTRKAVKEIVLKGKKGAKVAITRRNIEKFCRRPKRYPLRRGRDAKTWSACRPALPGPKWAASC